MLKDIVINGAFPEDTEKFYQEHFFEIEEIKKEYEKESGESLSYISESYIDDMVHFIFYEWEFCANEREKSLTERTITELEKEGFFLNGFEKVMLSDFIDRIKLIDPTESEKMKETMFVYNESESLSLILLELLYGGLSLEKVLQIVKNIVNDQEKFYVLKGSIKIFWVVLFQKVWYYLISKKNKNL